MSFQIAKRKSTASKTSHSTIVVQMFVLDLFNKLGFCWLAPEIKKKQNKLKSGGNDVNERHCKEKLNKSLVSWPGQSPRIEEVNEKKTNKPATTTLEYRERENDGKSWIAYECAVRNSQSTLRHMSIEIFVFTLLLYHKTRLSF